eukprot:1056611-Prymnesium_polylepis.1
MSADPPALSIKLSRRGTFANPSRICANREHLRELARMCEPVAANVRTEMSRVDDNPCVTTTIQTGQAGNPEAMKLPGFLEM